MLHCSSLVLRDVVRCDMNLIFFLFSLVSDFYGKKESVDAPRHIMKRYTDDRSSLENRRIMGRNFPDDRSGCSPERKQEVLSDQEYQRMKKRKGILVEGLRRVRVRSHANFSERLREINEKVEKQDVVKVETWHSNLRVV